MRKTLKNFDKAKKEASEKIEELKKERDKIETEFNKKFEEISAEILSVSEEYGVPIEDNHGRVFEENKDRYGEWFYVPNSIVEWPKKLFEDPNNFSELNIWFDPKELLESGGEWIGSSC